MQLEGLEIQHKVWEFILVLRPKTTALKLKIGPMITTYNSQLRNGFRLMPKLRHSGKKGEM